MCTGTRIHFLKLLRRLENPCLARGLWWAPQHQPTSGVSSPLVGILVFGDWHPISGKSGVPRRLLLWKGITAINLLFTGGLYSSPDVVSWVKSLRCRFKWQPVWLLCIFWKYIVFLRANKFKTGVGVQVLCFVSLEGVKKDLSREFYFFQRGLWIQNFLCMYCGILDRITTKYRSDFSMNELTVC